MDYNAGKIFPPGHFYSPIPSLDDITKKKDALFKCRSEDEIQGYDLSVSNQHQHFDVISKYRSVFCFGEYAERNQTMFYLKNGLFEGLDAFSYFSFILHYKPARIIEIGSGFSSLLSMNVNKLFFNNSIKITLIEPFPSDLLRSAINDHENVELITSPVQDVNISFLSDLNENDILFIDSTHVSKIGSDVNYLIFEVLPLIKNNVLIHFHDIFIPDEYPESWFYDENRAWNEMYILKSFLMFNSSFAVMFASHYYSTRFSSKLCDVFGKNIGGGSFWFKRLI